MDSTQRLARVSSLLDEAKAHLERGAGITDCCTHAWKNIDEAQRVLLGDAETDPSAN